MQNDRKLLISVGSHRYSKEWIQTAIMWSKLIERLRIPLRTPETYENYMKLPKRQKGELKDVGGFVGGTINGSQRKASAITGRDLITLDLDNIAAGETDNTVRRVDSLGIAYAVYSTRSHAP